LENGILAGKKLLKKNYFAKKVIRFLKDPNFPSPEKSVIKPTPKSNQSPSLPSELITICTKAEILSFYIF
jgi:hypothetical protein